MPRKTTAASDVPAVDLDEDLWNTKRASKFLGVPEATLKDWRYRGDTGPTFIRVGGHIRYEPAAVRRWLESNRRGVA